MQLEFGNVDFLDTHQLRQRLSENASRVKTRVQQVGGQICRKRACKALCIGSETQAMGKAGKFNSSPGAAHSVYGWASMGLMPTGQERHEHSQTHHGEGQAGLRPGHIWIHVSIT